MTAQVAPADRFWTMVKFDLVREADEAAFNSWYDNIEAPEMVSNEGVHRGWRTHELDRGPRTRDRAPEWWAIYELDAIEVLSGVPTPRDHGAVTERRGPHASPPPGDTPIDAIPGASFDFQHQLTNWSRPFYSVLSQLESSSRAWCWARDELVVHGDASARAEFERYVHCCYLPSMLRQPGVRRAWQLRHQPTDLQIGVDPPGNYLHLFEVDGPDALPEPEELVAAAAGHTDVTVRHAGRHYAELLIEIGDGT